jgi:hypothetical protein
MSVVGSRCMGALLYFAAVRGPLLATDGAGFQVGT